MFDVARRPNRLPRMARINADKGTEPDDRSGRRSFAPCRFDRWFGSSTHIEFRFDPTPPNAAPMARSAEGGAFIPDCWLVSAPIRVIRGKTALAYSWFPDFRLPQSFRPTTDGIPPCACSPFPPLSSSSSPPPCSPRTRPPRPIRLHPRASPPPPRPKL